jgi:hypothetical protein
MLRQSQIPGFLYSKGSAEALQFFDCTPDHLSKQTRVYLIATSFTYQILDEVVVVAVAQTLPIIISVKYLII